jgi:hypothetical protein
MSWLLFRPCAAITMTMALACCSAVSPQMNKDGTVVKILRSESFEICPDGRTDTQHQLLNNDAEWKALFSRGQLSSPGLDQWQPDFSRSSIAVVRMGSKPSSGYSLSIVESLVSENDSSFKTIILKVSRKSPSPDTLSTTIVTAPCAIVQVEGKGLTMLKVVPASSE